MPVEREAKIRVESHEPVRERLRSAGAMPAGRVIESNAIYDRPDGSLARAGCGLRLRWVGGRSGPAPPGTLTFKGPVMAALFKEREEVEVAVSDVQAMATLLNAIGFTVVLRYDKHRETWKLNDCKVELDEPPGLGLFVEVEGPTEHAIREVLARLELSAAPVERGSYVKLLLDYCGRQGIPDRTLLLDPPG